MSERDEAAAPRAPEARTEDEGADPADPFTADWRAAGFLLAGVFVGVSALPGYWVLLLPLLAAGAMLWLWHRRGRDPGQRSVAPQYAPPDGLSPGAVGVLVDHSLDLRDITATLADLSHRGLVEIEETGDRRSTDVGEQGTDYLFVRTSGPERWEAELQPPERDLLYALFAEERLSRQDLPELDAGDVVKALRGGADPGKADGDVDGISKKEMFRRLVTGHLEGSQMARALYGEGRERIRMSELEDSFYLFLPALHTSFRDHLVERGYYARRPGGRRGIYALAAVGAAGIAWFGGSPLEALAGILAALVIGGMGWMMPARTRKGARALAEARGLEKFLDRVEEDRFRRMINSPEDFEAHLPYAVALGVDGKWADAFSTIYSQPDEEEPAGDRLDWSGLQNELRAEAEEHGMEGSR